MITTTLKDIRAAGPCHEGWETYLKSQGVDPAAARSDETERTVLSVLESNGLDDALWVLGNVVGGNRICTLFACDCAEMVLPLFERERPDDMRPRDAIAVARSQTSNSAAEAAARAAAAWDAARALEAAWSAARAVAAWAAARAVGAAWAAARAAAARGAAAWAAEAARAATRAAAWAAEAEDAAWAAIKARLVQYLTHGEDAQHMDWPEKLIFNPEDAA